MSALRRRSLETTKAEDGLDAALMSQLQTLAASQSPSTASDGVSVTVKGQPLSVIVQLLSKALLQQRAQLLSHQESAEQRARDATASLTEVKDLSTRIIDDIQLSHRPFAFAEPSRSFSGQRQRTAPNHARTAAADTLADAIRVLHRQLHSVERHSKQTSSKALAARADRCRLEGCFRPWVDRGKRRVRAAELEMSARRDLVATFYARWREACAERWKRQRHTRERHLRATTRRSQLTLLRQYLHKWTAAVHIKAAEKTRLQSLQQRIAESWSKSGPAVTASRRSFYATWQQWVSARRSARQAALTPHAPSGGDAEADAFLRRRLFSLWKARAQRRRLLQLLRRLSRVMAAQNTRVALLHFFRQWSACASRSRRLRRLELLAADGHKRRLTALARRYFNELRFFRREQQFQRMMRSVEVSLLTLADRLTDVERQVRIGDSGYPAIAAGGSYRTSAAPQTPQRTLNAPTRPSPSRVQWSPQTDAELRARVDELLSRSR